MTAALLAVLSFAALLLWREQRRLHFRLLDQRARMDVLDLHIKTHAAIRRSTTECVLRLNERLEQLEDRVEKAAKQWGPCQ